ncbi:MAG: SDR family NAD(P)-dependent oxidoreductase, partial [Gemmatimonadetes bacterium]|nr:SDR family NAD(P)-dependent oxidoreductase [Gemmatimonadota bacterium]
GRVCFITGASSGLGEGLAIRLVREGYAVGLSARREALLSKVADRIRAEGGTAAVYPCDASDGPAVIDAIRRCEDTLGPVDLLVANAGMSLNTLIEAFDASGVEKVLDVNLLGAVYATEAVLAGMLERGRGQIVAVSSIAGFAGLPMSAAYSASKGGMTNFFESLRIDLRGTGVDVTVIHPGFVRTPMTAHNRHAMPFIMDLEPAVELMVKAIRKRKKSLAFPWQLAGLVWSLRILPRPAYDWIASRIDRTKAPEAGGPTGQSS